jgi:NAD(P)-dependent dehydrogenase (short-subunit alcohol dehydrogenase family)
VAGYDLVLRSRSGCAEIASETDGLGVAGSVLDDAGIARAVETTMERFGRIDAAVFGARRHSEVMKGHKVALPPAATRENFSYETARARSSIFHGQHGRTTMT